MVTRVAPRDGHAASLAHDIADTLLGEPRALAVGALVLLGLALVPGLPSWPFLAIGAACAFGAFSATRRRRARHEPSSLSSEALYLELGSALHARLAPRGTLDRALTDALDGVLRELHDALGISLPRATPLASSTLAANELRWSWRELPGPTLEPASSELTTTIVIGLRTLARSRAAESLDLDEVSRRLDELAREQPALVSATIPHRLAPSLLAEVLRRLVSEGVSVRWLAEILSAIAPHAAHDAAPHALVERARRALARRISHALAPSGQLHVLRLSPELEETLTDCLRKGEHDDVLALPPSLAHEITQRRRRRTPEHTDAVCTRDASCPAASCARAPARARARLAGGVRIRADAASEPVDRRADRALIRIGTCVPMAVWGRIFRRSMLSSTHWVRALSSMRSRWPRRTPATWRHCPTSTQRWACST